MFDVISKHSPINFCELILSYEEESEPHPSVLKRFFLNWENRIPQKQLALTVINNSSFVSDENIDLIEEYTGLGVIDLKVIDRDLTFSEQLF